MLERRFKKLFKSSYGNENLDSVKDDQKSSYQIIKMQYRLEHFANDKVNLNY